MLRLGHVWFLRVLWIPSLTCSNVLSVAIHGGLALAALVKLLLR